MDNNNNNVAQKAYFQIGVGWLRQTKNGEEYISASTQMSATSNPKYKSRNAKLFAELDNGELVPVDSFAVYFNNKEEGSKAPDVRFVMSK